MDMLSSLLRGTISLTALWLAELLQKKRPRPGPVATATAAPPVPWVGLANMGNSCYINALVQVLFATPALLTTLKEVAAGFDRLEAQGTQPGREYTHLARPAQGDNSAMATRCLAVRELARLARDVPVQVQMWKESQQSQQHQLRDQSSQCDTDDDVSSELLIARPAKLVEGVRKQFGQHQQDVQELSHYLFDQMGDMGKAGLDERASG